MSRFRLLPNLARQAVLRGHCGHARYVWNLAVEQHSHWRPGRRNSPGYLEQCRQLTAARAEYPWLAAGSQTVQQQALRDFSQAMTAFFNPHNQAERPSWRKVGQVWVPKAGWARFRWSRAVPPGVKSYRVTMDRAGRVR
jgi:putative transposase